MSREFDGFVFRRGIVKIPNFDYRLRDIGYRWVVLRSEYDVGVMGTVLLSILNEVRVVDLFTEGYFDGYEPHYLYI